MPRSPRGARLLGAGGSPRFGGIVDGSAGWGDPLDESLITGSVLPRERFWAVVSKPAGILVTCVSGCRVPIRNSPRRRPATVNGGCRPLPVRQRTARPPPALVSLAT